MPDGKTGSLSKPAFLYPIGAIGALAIAFFVYYFSVTVRQESSLNQRALRILAGVADSFHNRVLNMATVVGQATKAKGESGATDENSFEDYLKEQATDLVSKTEKTPEKCISEDGTIGTRRGREEWEIEFGCKGTILATLPVAKAVAPYLDGVPSQMFDEVLIADSQGAVLYQSLRAGIPINSLAGIPIRDGQPLEADPKKEKSPSYIPSLSQSTTVSDVSIGGQDFKLFMTPIALQHRGGNHMIAVGLILDERFRSESMALPGAALNAFGLSVLVVIMAAWPILKFNFMRRTDRLPRRSPSYFFLSILGTTILLCVLAIHLRYVFITADIDQNLSNLSVSIDRNLAGELRRALRVMVSMKASDKFDKAFGEKYRAQNCIGNKVATDTALGAKGDYAILGKQGLQLSDYPYFDRVIFADNKGYQHLKWEVGPHVTSPTYIGDREYFRGTVNGDLWRLTGDLAAPRFRLDPVFSRATGEYRAVISIDPGNARLCLDRRLAVMSMVTPLLSLTDPAMPPDYGFVLLDPDGRVQFHSTSALSGRGNFLDDLDDPRDLRAAIQSVREVNLWARHQGLGMRLRSSPVKGIDGIPWTLVVFHEVTQSEAHNEERILLFAVLALTYFVIASVMVLLIPIEKRTPTWIWPSEDRKGACLHLIAVVLAIVPAFYSLIFELERARYILAAAVFVPLLTLAAAIFKLKSKKLAGLIVSAIPFTAGILVFGATSTSSLRILFLISALLSLLSIPELERWFGRWRRPSASSSFALLCSLMLMLAGLLPCVAFFKVAYDYEASLLTRREQLQTIDALASREARIKDRYRIIPLAEKEPSGSDEISRWLFLRRRLDEATDRYDNVAFNIQGRSLSESSISTIGGDCIEDQPSQGLTLIAGYIPYGKGALTRAYSQTETNGQGRWRWCGEGGRRIRLAPGAMSRSNRDSTLRDVRAFEKAVAKESVFLYPSVVSEIPRLGAWPGRSAVVTFLGAWLLAFLWVRPTLRLMFRKDETVVPLPEVGLDDSVTFDADSILLAPDTRAASAYFQRRPEAYVVDFAVALRGTPPDYRNSLPLLVIDNFDYQLGVPEADAKRLEALEGLLLANPERRLLLLASTDPAFYFTESNVDSVIGRQDAVRWSRCLRRFKTVRLAGNDKPAVADFPLIWHASTASEKAALYQLARDGLANPGNWAALQHLQLRNLISGWPLEIRDPAFARYVRSVASASERRSWQKQDAADIWDGIRLTVVVVALGVLAAVLFFKQQTSLSYIVTGMGILTPLSRLLTEVRGLPGLLGFGGGKKE